MSAAQTRWLAMIFVLALSVEAMANSNLLNASVLSGPPDYSNCGLIFKGSGVSLDTLQSPLAQPRPADLQLSLAIFFQPFPVRLMGERLPRRGTNVRTLLLFFQRMVTPNRSPCQIECSAQCEHSYSCPLLQDRAAKND